MTTNFLYFLNYEKLYFIACVIKCLMLKSLTHYYHFKSGYVSRFVQQSAPRTPPSFAFGSIDHYTILGSAFVYFDGLLGL